MNEVSSLTDRQQFVVQKLQKTTENVTEKVKNTVTDIFQFMADNRSMDVSELVRQKITPISGPLPEMDQRINKFFQKVMVPITANIEGTPLKQSFQMFTLVTGDSQIQKKIVENLACPFIQSLANEFDREAPSIVDDIINN